MLRRSFCSILLSGLLAGSMLPISAAEGDKLFFSRDFPGSAPEYFDVTVHRDGKVIYREALDDSAPIEFVAPEADISRLFEISETLGYFAQPLEVPKKKSAFTGNKILRYVKASGETNEARFVVASAEEAQELVDWFLKVGDTEWYYINIERTFQFDRLGVNKAISLFQAAYNRGRIVAPKQFIPLLQNIANDMKIMHLARSRAAGIIEQIEAKASAGE